MQINHFTELRVYQRAFEVAARIFVISKRWPLLDEKWEVGKMLGSMLQNPGPFLLE